MNEILLTNVFFIITGATVLIVGTFLCFACYHLIKVVKTARAILAQLEIGTESLLNDVKALRNHLANGNIFDRILTAVVGAVTTIKQTRTPTRKKKDTAGTNE